MESDLILIFSFIVVLGVSIQWLAWRFQVPAIVLLLMAGFALGPVLGWLDPEQTFGHILPPLIALSVAIILFEGGLNLQWHEYKEAGVDVRRLVSLGLFLTWTLNTAAAHFIAGLSWPIATLFGAISVVTGPTVLMPLLKFARLQRRTAALLKWEGIINDPLGALLAILVFQYWAVWYWVMESPEHGILAALGNLGLGLLAATSAGIGFGYLLSWAFHRGHVPEFLKSPVMLGAVLLLYVAINAVQEEAGLLAVTVAGVVVANQRLRNIEELRRFKEHITLILVSTLFIVLSANIELETLARLDWHSLALLGIAIFFVRPLSVYLATLGTGIKWRERLLIAWIAPRGIVAASMAGLLAFPLIQQGFKGADQLLPLVFALIAATVILHGLTMAGLGRLLGLAAHNPNGVLIVGATPWSVDLARSLKKLGIPVIVNDTSWHHLRAARLSNLEIYRGQILSEIAETSLELNAISYVLAVTANDAYNALVCTRFAPQLGQNHVFQLPSIANSSEKDKTFARSARGRIAFDENTQYEDFMRHYYHGWEFRSTQLTEEYTYEDYLQDRPQELILIAVVTKNGQLTFYPLAGLNPPETGDTIISFSPDDSES
ncbi:cation:proton antiporter [Nitrosococcus oceani]|uniref:Sodium/proton antiporter, CPA1 family n=2 Tax=Nitrosococcus oceani TaxID=1229 RepID=Q3JDQ3_NITOC|nr:sodium:proton antiporter [Nitrosococcus oceani]KFI20513.1 sodium:proton exchanger [Nitrosococcus oceani C-27]ABA57043.1 sodium/proton antiporter, CPA1 family [Nitrosococcus oceani ATCC 19707]EDZ65375.1 transporter, CPA2 family [Nitrosococcus oceani AFC27]KFI23619.1 sodium:proton exchanger [Nitrosococcus oceani]GEM19944.1 sodium/hydrogen exchanger [Nitrosococcus oceani]